MHVLETLLWNAVVIAIWIGITPCRAAGTTRRPSPARGSGRRVLCQPAAHGAARVGHGLSTAVAAEATGARPRPWSDVVLGLVMALFVALQFVVKYTRGGWLDVWYLLMPCHVYTAALAFCLLSRDRRWVNRVFTVVGVYYAWGPILALAFPDFSDQVYGTTRAPHAPRGPHQTRRVRPHTTSLRESPSAPCISTVASSLGQSTKSTCT